MIHESLTRRIPGRSFTKRRIEDISNSIGIKDIFDVSEHLQLYRMIQPTLLITVTINFTLARTGLLAVPSNGGEFCLSAQVLFIDLRTFLGDDAKRECGSCGFCDVPGARISSKYESRKTSSPFYK